VNKKYIREMLLVLIEGIAATAWNVFDLVCVCNGNFIQTLEFCAVIEYKYTQKKLLQHF